ncbi:tyrosine-type recombinase/integrase [Polaribacter aestuariivivens]|uniref:tyrosine-type recombinase/integrase n=1 Tax=Polaribacter aestuariivivens TaxID=2304626 RepID=UPI003F497D27
MYFSLKNQNSNKDTLIILRYYISKTEGRFVFSTGINIGASDWDKENKIAKNLRGRTDLRAINRNLEKYSTFLEKTLNYLELNEIEPTREILKEKFNSEFKKEVTGKLNFKYFTDFVSDFILKAPELTNRNTRKKYNTITLRHYKKVNTRLIDFEEKRGSKIRIDKFNIAIYDELLDYLNEKGYAQNTIGSFIKYIKIFLGKAEEFGYKVHKDYEHNYFSVIKEESISIALRLDEIDKIFNYDFSDNRRLENTRDIAIVGLWTGLRVSDFLNLEEIKLEDDFIEVQPRKTKNSSGIKVVIPLHHQIKEVIRQRGMPRKISDVKFNLYFKEVCEKVGLTEKVKGSLLVKDKEKEIFRKKVGMYEKYKLVSSHTCRRSFATNFYLMGIPTLTIMAITGHTTEKSFLTYIKVTPKEHANKMLEMMKNYYKNKTTT